MKHLPVSCLFILIFIVTSCEPYEVDPILSSYVNTDAGQLSFINKIGDRQIITVDVMRGEHGTGPFGPQEKNLQTSYLPAVAGFKFFLGVDGDDGHQYLTFSPGNLKTPSSGGEMIFLLPCESGLECEIKTKTHDQLSINGILFQDVIAVSVTDSFEGPFSAQEWDQGFDSLYLAKQQGLVGFTTHQGDTFSLDK